MSHSTLENGFCGDIRKKHIESYGDSIHSGKSKIEPVEKHNCSIVNIKHWEMKIVTYLYWEDRREELGVQECKRTKSQPNFIGSNSLSK